MLKLIDLLQVLAHGQDLDDLFDFLCGGHNQPAMRPNAANVMKNRPMAMQWRSISAFIAARSLQDLLGCRAIPASGVRAQMGD